MKLTRSHLDNSYYPFLGMREMHVALKFPKIIPCFLETSISLNRSSSTISRMLKYPIGMLSILVILSFLRLWRVFSISSLDTSFISSLLSSSFSRLGNNWAYFTASSLETFSSTLKSFQKWSNPTFAKYLNLETTSLSSFLTSTLLYSQFFGDWQNYGNISYSHPPS